MAKNKNIERIDPILSKAFFIWLVKIGYRGINRTGETQFYCEVVNERFPRNVVVMASGRLNKPASQLFKEFKAHLAA
jgi:hypothetical protein